MPLDFVFKEETHQYFVDGVEAPSVTTALANVGISDFSGVPFENLKYAQDLGKAVHAATEAHDQDDLDYASIAGTVVEPYVKAWGDFRIASGFTPRMIERRGVAQVQGQRYGFCIDREGDLGGKATVLDIKTGQPSRSWAIQLAAYELALRLLDGQHRQRVVVRLTSGGNYVQVPPFTGPLDEHVWRWALGLETWKSNNQ